MSSLDADRVAGRTSPFPSSSRSGILSPLPSASLTQEHVTEALANSPDNGATLDFTHKGLTDVGEDGAEHLATVGKSESHADSEESSVTRIALGYNRLATLPTAFALLSRLRYLNLKNNSFSVFPDVLTVMPCLEILDISRNKIKRLPAQPGSLADLHVFSMSRNKITRLPGYLGDFAGLSVLKVDHNPIEWPPKAVVEVNGSPNDPQAAKDWTLSLQRWLRENSHPHLDVKIKPSVESFVSERAALNHSIIESWTRIGDESYSAGPTPHARTFSVDAQFPPLPMPGPSKPAISPRFERPPPLRLGPLPPYDLPLRSSSPESYLPTPDESVSSTDDDHTAVPDGSQHSRSGSFMHSSRDRRPALFGKKSIPDLRTSWLSEHGDDVKPSESCPVSTATASSSLPDGKPSNDFIMPSPLSNRQDSSSSSERSSQHRVPKQPATTPPSSASPTFVEGPHTVPDTERHAYFKRLSALPANTISNNLSASLRSLVECSRSLFFAVSQIYQAISHYITYTIDQKLSSVLRKVTDPAYTYMMQLNGALERFDAMAKEMTPPSSLCRALVESSRDTAAVFGKAIAMLSLQLKILASNDDDRYMRSLVLIFYGAVAEISHAWQGMVPHIEVIKPHLVEHRRIAALKTHAGPTTALPGPDPPPTSAHAGNSPFAGSQHKIPIARSRPTPNTLGRARTTRRHAGSFSSKDVEIGKSLPSYDLPPPPSALLSSTPSPTLRAGQRHPAMPLSASTSSLAPSLMAAGLSANVSLSASLPSHSPFTTRNGNHSRQPSQASLSTSSSSSSPLVPHRRPTLEIPQSSTLVDKDALDSMGAAVDSAPAVWEMMKEIVGSLSEMPWTSQDIQDSIDKAKGITERLRANIVAVREADPTADRRALREDAHVFVKTVVALSNVIKTYGSSHALFPDLRAKMVALTNATQEFVMLLHVSSFSPSTTPRPSSPMRPAQPIFFNLVGSGSGLEDSRLGANLSRSQSTQQPKALKLVAPGSSNLPRSALPNQSQFNIPMPPRYLVPGSSGVITNGSGSRVDHTADEG
ncbi:RAM signaling pathway protein-domain-containing protein [Melanogaster broomeanus]|nr:RAM signaling pathway protein-domain-containing protein [Melanogaster broomeanus]